jgi:caffeic acid 3-O-methyltransferase
VVATNASLPGVEQVGGDMFEKVPSGCDAIFMKGILHDWNDEHCIKILKNCWTALSNAGGKLILLDQIMPMETPLETSVPKVRQTVFVTDTLMQFHCPSGRERTAMELEGLLKQTGFTSFQVVAEVGFNYVMEAFKQISN